MAKLSIERPWHKHALTLRELSENCRVDCSICGQRFHGQTYCCEDCDLFVHELCSLIEFPPQMQHPSHPQHPLALDACTYQCSCGDCDFSLDALVAVSTLPRLPKDGHSKEKEEEMVLRHLAHPEHPLTSFHVDTELPIECSRCGERISGHVYGCRTCIFLLHEPCAQSPNELHQPAVHQHPLTLVNVSSTSERPSCIACCSPIYGNVVYYCQECQFNLDLKCATKILLPRDEKMMEHFSHDHQLAHFHVKEGTHLPIGCKVCNEKVSGEVYGCFLCSFFLHRSCADRLPQQIQHYLHSEHPLFLQAGPKSRCASCSEDHSGLAFTCRTSICNFEMHPRCALQTLAAAEAGVAISVPHFALPTLTLRFFKESTHSSCFYCHQPIQGLGYNCTGSNFTMQLHKSCAEMPWELAHGFHPPHPLIFSSKASAGYFYCGACNERSTGFTYHCAECEFYLDTGCASLNPTLKHPRHKHRLTYFEKNVRQDTRLQCKSCGKRCTRDFHCCVPCDFSLHNDCLPLPPVVQHKGHLHPLALRDEFIDGDPNYQYCDYCETIRNPDHGIYHCEECSFSAHIGCVIPDSQAESSNGPTEISDNYRLAQVTIEIASLKEKMEVMRKNLVAVKGNLEACMEQLDVLEIVQRKYYRRLAFD